MLAGASPWAVYSQQLPFVAGDGWYSALKQKHKAFRLSPANHSSGPAFTTTNQRSSVHSSQSQVPITYRGTPGGMGNMGKRGRPHSCGRGYVKPRIVGFCAVLRCFALKNSGLQTLRKYGLRFRHTRCDACEKSRFRKPLRAG